MSEHKFLRYGDHIYFTSNENPKSYLCARSILEERVFFIQAPPPDPAFSKEKVDSTLYENQAELVFTIYPKLNYQAGKNYNKLKGEDSLKTELLKKRLGVEEDQNEKLIQKSLGTIVTFGSEIQLYHVSSKSFVRTTREKNPWKNDLYNLKLSKGMGSGMYFKIVPYLSFKKEGEKISLKDLFFLENTKLQAAIVYKNIPEFPPIDTVTAKDDEQLMVNQQSFGRRRIQENKANTLQVPCMPILELTTTFMKYEAGLQQNVNRHGDSKCPFQAHSIFFRNPNLGNLVGSSKLICWGDYVRLKFMIDNKNAGYFYCDHTIIGDAPHVYCKTVRAALPAERDSFQAIFQIIPDSEERYGAPIQFKTSKFVSLRLRHLLTGRYLMIGNPDEKCTLSETLDEYIEQQSKLPSKPNTEGALRSLNEDEILNSKGGKGFKGPLRKQQEQPADKQSNPIFTSKSGPLKQPENSSNPSLPSITNLIDKFRMRQPQEPIKKNPSADKKTEGGLSLNIFQSQQNLPIGEIVTEKEQGQPGSIFQDPLQDLQLNEEDRFGPIKKFIERTRITMQNASQDEEEYLTTNSVFSLESQFLGVASLSVGSFLKEKAENERAQNISKTHPGAFQQFFHARFHKRNPLEKEEYEAVYSKQSDKYFHFSSVPAEEISEVLTIQSRLYPLVKVIQETKRKVEDNTGDRNQKNAAGEKAKKRSSLQTSALKNTDLAERRQIVVAQALEAVKKLNVWLDGTDPTLETGELSKKVKQKMFRELGVIDILFFMLGKFFTKNFLKAEGKDLATYKPLTQAIFSLLKSILLQNRVNNIYVFQWSQLQQEMTLSQTIASDLGVDKLLSQIFYENIIEIGELKAIPQHLIFKNYDLKALNIAIALYQFNPERSPKDRDQIISTLIINIDNRSRIFRKFVRDQLGDIIVENVDGEKSLRIDTSLEYRNKKEFDYTLGIVNLATEIAKSKPQVVCKHLSEYFPQELCTDIFESKKWNHLFRSGFLELFMEMYFAVATAQLPALSFPQNIKFLANVRVPEAIYNLFQSRKDTVIRNFLADQFDIKGFIHSFLNDPHKWAEDEHKYVQSVFKLIYFMCQKGLYNLTELRRLKQAVYNYLTIGLAVVHDEIMPESKMGTAKTFTRKVSKLRSKTKKDTLKIEKSKDKKKDKNKKKGNKIEEKMTVDETTYLKKGLDQENKPMTYEQIPEDDETAEKDRGTTYWRKTEVSDMIQWMQEALNTLIFIEKYELDNKLKEFFEHDKSLRFFNEKLLSRTDANEGFNAIFLAKIKKDKLDYVLKYMNDNFASQNYDHILLLLEMLLINNLALTGPLVQLLYLNFSNYKQFLTGVNDAQIIYSSNVEIYERFYKIYDSLRFYEVELDSLYGRQIHTKSADIYVAIDLTLTELLRDLFEDTEKLDKRGQLAYEKVVQIYEEYLFEPVSGREKQNLLLKLGFFQLVTDLFIPLVDGTNLKDESKREKFLKNFLYFYVYFCFKNPENQQVMAKNNELIESLFDIHFPSLQPLLLRLISDIYRDSYSLLINVSQSRPNVIQLLLKKFFEKFSWQAAFENSFYIYCLRVFPTFFQIRNNFLTHNQTFFASNFHSYVVQNKTQYDINFLLATKLKQTLVHKRFEECSVPGKKELVKVPLEISFAIHFLNIFASMTTGPQSATGQQSSNSNACLKNKSYLTIDEISYLIKNSGNWFNLKLALVRYLNEVYVKNKKLEDNEVSELYSVMRGTMFEEINEYLRFLKNRHLYGGWSLDQKFVQSFEEYYPIATEVKYGQLIDEVYHQYILYGVIDCFHYYSQRIKDEHSEEDHALLDDYVSSGLKDIHELWKSGIFQKKNTLSDTSGTFLKHKMIAPLEEPTDPDINEGDIYNPQKNERKKVSQLKKEMTVLREEIQSLDIAVDIRISTLDKVEAHKGKSTNDFMMIDHQTIEKKHNNELEVLIKFLLESKEDEPWKFQLTIKSFMNVLSSEDTSGEIKQLTLKILRKLSNFKEDPELYEAIQLDFIQLNFIDFFDDIIINAKTEDDRLEFLMGMIDFLDDASPKIQQELYEILVKDEDNLLLETIAKFIKTSFEEFRDNEKNYDKQNEEIQQNAKSVVYKRMYGVVYALEFLRLACENHYEDMQHYLRDQVQEGSRNKRSINFITLIADIFSRYTKSVNELNARLGVQILDTLIEMLQGPCQENQIALCNTKVLETLEDLTVEVKKNRNKKEDLVWIEMNKKIIILIQAILEGSYNSYIVQQVAIHLNVSFFLERMMEAFIKTSKERNRTIKKKSQTKLNHFMTLDFLEGQLKDQGKYDAAEISYDALLHEGIELAIILNFLSDASSDIKQQVETFKEKLEPEKLKSFLKAESFYSRYIGQIEIVNKKGDLQRIYFPIVKKTKYLSGVTKMKFLDEVKRESANEKLFGLLRYQKLFINEMDHFLNLRQRGLKFSLTHFSRLRSANLLLAFVTNLIILFSFKEDLTYNLSGGNGINGAVRALGIAHIIISALVIIFWGIFKAPLDLKAGKMMTLHTQDEFLNVEKEEDHEISGFTAKMNYWASRANYMIFHTYMVYLFLALLFSFLGTFYSIIFFAFLLIDLVDRSVILNNVVRAVTLNYKQLLMTFCLGILLIYIYAVIGFYSVVDDPDLVEEYCSSVWHCFLTLANDGLRAGGGIGDVFDNNNRVPYGQQSFTQRYFFELFYFLMIIVILLNIIFGIIIDTFAELRDQKQLKDYDETNVCFICNLERTQFEKEGKSFEKHVRTEHSVWNYLYYMVYLKNKDKLEYNGTESYIYHKLQNEDLSWFPIQRSMSLALASMEDEQDLKAVLQDKLEGLEKRISQMFAANFGGNQSFSHLKSL